MSPIDQWKKAGGIARQAAEAVERDMKQEDLKRLRPELEQQAEKVFVEQAELDAIERPAAQVKVEAER